MSSAMWNSNILFFPSKFLNTGRSKIEFHIILWLGEVHRPAVQCNELIQSFCTRLQGDSFICCSNISLRRFILSENLISLINPASRHECRTSFHLSM